MYPYVCFYGINKYNKLYSVSRFNEDGLLVEFKFSDNYRYLILHAYDWCTKYNCCIFTMT